MRDGRWPPGTVERRAEAIWLVVVAAAIASKRPARASQAMLLFLNAHISRDTPLVTCEGLRTSSSHQASRIPGALPTARLCRLLAPGFSCSRLFGGAAVDWPRIQTSHGHPTSAGSGDGDLCRAAAAPPWTDRPDPARHRRAAGHNETVR